MDNRVDVLVHIRKNETGEIRIYKDDLSLDEDNFPNTFMWEDGNYACDCNRRLFFARVNGEDEDWESDCSDTEYSVNVMLGNECIYSEFENLPKERVLQDHAPKSVHPALLCTCLYEVGGDDMSLNPDCPVHGSHSG